MDMTELPLFWLAYLSDPSDSGRIHSNIRQRWLSGMPSNQTLCILFLKGIRGTSHTFDVIVSLSARPLSW